MSYKLIVTRPVSQAIGACGLSRHLVVSLLNALYATLEADADRYRTDRDEEEPEACFRFRFFLDEGDVWHLCHFKVNDTTAEGVLLVEGFVHEERPGV